MIFYIRNWSISWYKINFYKYKDVQENKILIVNKRYREDFKKKDPILKIAS